MDITGHNRFGKTNNAWSPYSTLISWQVILTNNTWPPYPTLTCRQDILKSTKPKMKSLTQPRALENEYYKATKNTKFSDYSCVYAWYMWNMRMTASVDVESRAWHWTSSFSFSILPSQEQASAFNLKLTFGCLLNWLLH